MLYIFTSVFSSLAAITSAITITYPDKIIALMSKDSDDFSSAEEQVDNLSSFERFYLLISFSQIPMIILMFFMESARFNFYIAYMVIMFLISLKFKKALLQNSLIFQLLTAIELFIAIDVIRSCISLV